MQPIRDGVKYVYATLMDPRSVGLSDELEAPTVAPKQPERAEPYVTGASLKRKRKQTRQER